MYEFFKEEERFTNLPKTKNQEILSVYDNFLKRINSDEGKKRMKSLGITKSELLKDIKFIEDPTDYGYYRGQKNTVAIHPDLELKPTTTRHEIEHAVQNAALESSIDLPFKVQLKQMFTEDSPNFIMNDIYDAEVENDNEDDDDSEKIIISYDRVEIEEEISRLRIRANAVSFVDPVDLRYNNFSKKPAPISQAVVFFVMDVSASMTQDHKDLAKRFFMLLNLFVSRKYKRVDCVFIRHHILATECDEHDFFNNKENGGTIVSSAFKLAKEIIDDRYSPNEWNLYFSQASDGDNWDNDNEELLQVLSNDILPITQYFSYIQVGTKRHGYYNSGNLLQEYIKLQANHKNIITKHIEDTFDIYPVFRELFKIKGKNE